METLPLAITSVMQVEGQQEVEKDVGQLLRGVRGQAILHHTQEELHKLCIQVFWKQVGQRLTS